MKRKVMMGHFEEPFLKYLLGFSYYVEAHTESKQINK